VNRKKRPNKTFTEQADERPVVAERAESGDAAKGAVRHPVLYQINTRVWLTDLSGQLGHPATLDDIPDEQLDGLKRLGFDWIYLLGIWQTIRASRSSTANCSIS
jgi:hypothetical protein